MKLVSPQGRTRPLSLGATPRPRALDGLRIGLLDNAKPPVDKMMVHIEEKLRERFPGVSTFTVSKPAASRPADEGMLKALRENADVVINALGD